MTEAEGIFDAAASFDPAADPDSFLRQVPARWAVYLLIDGDGRPVQLLCVKNLRASLKRRLGPDDPEAGPSRRVDYRQVVRRVLYRRVDSAFEADWIYYEAARVVFPGAYRTMVGFRPAWFVHVDPDAEFPKYAKTIDPSAAGGTFVGPVEDKHAAGRLAQLAEDAFDLCRYYHILLEAPVGRACAYKEMGKCPAPCDGTISMAAYRQLVSLSLRTLVDPQPMIREQEQRMRSAAGELRFETAAKIKQHMDLLGQLGKGAFRHARPLDDFRFLSLQHGPSVGQANVFVITPGAVEPVASLVAPPASSSGLLRLIFERGQRLAGPTLTPDEVERIGVVSHHLFATRAAQGIFLPLAEVEDKSLAKAYRELLKQKRADETDEESIEKELAPVPGPPAALPLTP